MRGLGRILLVGGLIGAFYYFAFFDTSVEVPTTSFMGETIGGGRVNNLGLMADRQNGIFLTVGVALIGLLMILFSPKNGSSPGEKKCPYCAEWIKFDATVCRFCNRDVGRPREVETPEQVGYRLRIKCANCGQGHMLFVSSDDVAYKGDVLRYSCPESGDHITFQVGDRPVRMQAPRRPGDIDAYLASMDRTETDSVANRA